MAQTDLLTVPSDPEHWFYHSSVPVFVHNLTVLGGLLAKIEDKKFAGDPWSRKLHRTMLPLRQQVKLACTFCTNFVCYVADVPDPELFETELDAVKVFKGLRGSIRWLEQIDPGHLIGQQDQVILVATDKNEQTGAKTWRQVVARDYLNYWILPNVHFHVTVVYGLLRQHGIQLVKADYIKGPGPSKFYKRPNEVSPPTSLPATY